jgi:hypothetical protein
MPTNIDAIIDKIVLNVYYKVWKNHPTFNKLESFWKQYNDLYIADTVEGKVNWGELEFEYTEEQINSIGWEERFEIIRIVSKKIKKIPKREARDFSMFNFQSNIIDKNWQEIFNSYSYEYTPYLFSCCSSLPYQLFKIVLEEFKFKTAIAKVKRNKIFILGLSMKISMRDCGIILVN